jgi:hypothetical protein
MSNFKLDRVKISFILLSALAVLIRLFKLDEIPAGFSWDEASIAYNAFSILKTGHDEWGLSFPLHFRAFGEWKLPVYIYSVIPFISVFNNPHLAARLPSIMSGLLSPFVLGLIWYKFTKNKVAGIIASLLLLFSFWSFSLSRSAFEANFSILILLVSVLFFLHKKYFISALGFTSLLYTYNSYRILLPLIIIGYMAIYRKNINWKKAAIFLATVLFFSLPLLRFIWMNSTALIRLDQVLPQDNPLIFVMKNYLTYFSPNFLLLNGDSNLRHFSSSAGQFSILAVILALVGIYRAIIEKKKDYLFLIFLLLISPIPAAITKDPGHSLRSILMLPVFLSLAVIGGNFLYDKYKKPLLIMTAFCAFQYVYFYADYFSSYTQRSLKYWQPGYRQLFEEINKIKGDKQVYISDTKEQPYIFYLLYNELIPELDKTEMSIPGKWSESRLKRIGEYYFEDDLRMSQLISYRNPGIFVADVSQKEYIPQDVKYITIKVLGEDQFYIVEY